MGFLVFCNADADGIITEYIAGIDIIPTKQYDHFFYQTEPIDVSEYQVIDGQLALK